MPYAVYVRSLINEKELWSGELIRQYLVEVPAFYDGDDPRFQEQILIMELWLSEGASHYYEDAPYALAETAWLHGFKQECGCSPCSQTYHNPIISMASAGVYLLCGGVPDLQAWALAAGAVAQNLMTNDLVNDTNLSKPTKHKSWASNIRNSNCINYVMYRTNPEICGCSGSSRIIRYFC